MTKKCNGCKTPNAEPKQIPLVSAECEAMRQHAIIKRLVGLVALLTLLLFGSNLAWVLFGGSL